MKFANLFLLTTILAFTHSYTVSQSIQFQNPIAEQRADPWVLKAEDGIYYLIATAPEYGRIVMRKAESINGLKGAPEKEVWQKHEKGCHGSPYLGP